jgi:hypothetical protein
MTHLFVCVCGMNSLHSFSFLSASIDSKSADLRSVYSLLSSSDHIAPTHRRIDHAAHKLGR